MRMWDAKTFAAIGEPLIGARFGVSSVAFSPKGDLIVSTSRERTVKMWDAKTHSAVGEPVAGWSVAFSPNGNPIVLGTLPEEHSYGAPRSVQKSAGRYLNTY